MLDPKTQLILNMLIKECPSGSYKIIDSRDIISSLPSKYHIDEKALDHILIYLERQEYISIKYDNEGTYCLCVLPYAKDFLDDEKAKKRENIKFPHFWFFIFICSTLSFVSSLLGCLFGNLIFHLF